MVESSLQYGYEYFGSYERLVMTPLTEKCFLVLTIALHHIKGGKRGGSDGDRQDGDGEGPVQGVRQAVHRVQLLRGFGLSASWEVHQRSRLQWRLELL